MSNLDCLKPRFCPAAAVPADDWLREILGSYAFRDFCSSFQRASLWQRNILTLPLFLLLQQNINSPITSIMQDDHDINNILFNLITTVSGYSKNHSYYLP